MFLTFEDRPADSPVIDRVWRCESAGGGLFTSMAESNLELVVSRLPGVTRVTLRGPVTRATTVACPPEGQWFAIRFRPGAHLPSFSTAHLLDHNDVDFPLCGRRHFWFEGAAWEIPSFDNAEAFVGRLVRRGIVANDPAVGAAVAGDPQALTRRSVQRHFLRVTGMTQACFRQIERARHAVQLLRGGVPILDVVHNAGYFDQAHLARSVKRLIGQTPGAIARQESQLSFLYKTEPEAHQ